MEELVDRILATRRPGLGPVMLALAAVLALGSVIVPSAALATGVGAMTGTPLSTWSEASAADMDRTRARDSTRRDATIKTSSC